MCVIKDLELCVCVCARVFRHIIGEPEIHLAFLEVPNVQHCQNT